MLALATVQLSAMKLVWTTKAMLTVEASGERVAIAMALTLGEELAAE